MIGMFERLREKLVGICVWMQLSVDNILDTKTSMSEWVGHRPHHTKVISSKPDAATHQLYPFVFVHYICICYLSSDPCKVGQNKGSFKDPFYCNCNSPGALSPYFVT